MSAEFDAWVERARAVPIQSVIEQRGIRLNGKTDRSGPCPKCGGEDRFSINVKENVWNCRGCKAATDSGDVIGFVQWHDGISFIAACTKLVGEPPPKPNGKDRAPRKIVAAEYQYPDENGAVLFVVERIEYQNVDGSFVLKEGKRKKSFRQRRPDPDKPGAWLWNVDSVPVVLYRLPEVIEAVAAGHSILIVEGEAKADLLWSWGVPATCCAEGAKKWKSEHSEYLRGTDVVLMPDNDDVGWNHVNQVGASLSGVAARIRVLLLPDLPPKGDIINWADNGDTRERLDALVESAPHWQPPPKETTTDDEAKAKAAADEQKLIDELAGLNNLDYERRRRSAARQMGIRSGALDDAINARRAEQAEEAGPPPLFGHWVVEPWPEAVDTSELILAIVGRIKRHIILSDDEALTVVLWILLAWVHDLAVVHSPILLVTSAEAASGKTQLINVIRFLVPRALPATGASEAALFRSVEKYEPTIIVDEADTLLVDNEPVRTVINNGWTRSDGVLRCIGDDHEPHVFSTFCPKILGMKGKRLPDTTLSRSIIIDMKRKKATEKVAAHFRSIDDAGLAELRRKCLRWKMDNGENLDGAEPVMPPGFDGRPCNNWSVQFAVADVAGGEWPTKARKAAMKLSKVADTTSSGVQALAAIKVAFDGEADAQQVSLERMSSADLAAALGADMTGPWAEWKGGKPITQAQLARVLKPFGIAPTKIRLPGGGTLQGYMRLQFEEAWERYL